MAAIFEKIVQVFSARLQCCMSRMHCFEVLLDSAGYGKVCDMGFARVIWSQSLNFHYNDWII